MATPEQLEALETLREAHLGMAEAISNMEEVLGEEAPSCRIIVSSDVVDEGAIVTFSILTTGIPTGTSLLYNIDGVSSEDIDIPLVGTIIIGQTGNTALSVAVKSDETTESVEILTLSIINFGTTLATSSVKIRDTSIDPPPGPEYSLIADPPTVDEGQTVTFKLSTTRVPIGTSFTYRLSGIVDKDISTPITGTITLDSMGRADIPVTVLNDLLTEGVEFITCTVEEIVSATATIRDTSVSPPPPPPTDRVEVWGPNIKKVGPGEANNFDNGIPDYIDISNIPPSVPWQIYADDKLTLAPSRNGVEALGHWQRYHLFGHTQGLYQPMPRVVDGKLYQIYPNAGNFPDHAVHLLRAGSEKLVHGKRGESVPTPYTTWHGHTRKDGSVTHTSPHIPLYIGITLHGHIVYAMRDGSMKEGGVVPVSSWANDFSFYEPNRKWLFYTDTGAGKIMLVDRNTTPWTTTVFFEGFKEVTSCRAIGENLYVADGAASEIWEINVPSKSKRLVCKLTNVFWLDYFSDGSLCAATRHLAVHKIDVATGTIGPNLTHSVYLSPGAQAWVTVDVDRWGNMGSVDTFVVLGVTAAVRGFHRINKNGATVEPPFGNFAIAAGPLVWVSEPWGHYPWTGAHHPDEALLMVQGMANLVPQLIVVKEPPTGWVGMRTPDSHAGWYDLGRNISLTGDVGPRMGTRYTTLLPQLSASGGGLVTADHMAYWEHKDLRAFILNGCLGVQARDFNRDAVQGWGMRVLLNSQRYLIDGWPLVQRWIDYCKTLPI